MSAGMAVLLFYTPGRCYDWAGGSSVRSQPGLFQDSRLDPHDVFFNGAPQRKKLLSWNWNASLKGVSGPITRLQIHDYWGDWKWQVHDYSHFPLGKTIWSEISLNNGNKMDLMIVGKMLVFFFQRRLKVFFIHMRLYWLSVVVKANPVINPSVTYRRLVAKANRAGSRTWTDLQSMSQINSNTLMWPKTPSVIFQMFSLWMQGSFDRAVILPG